MKEDKVTELTRNYFKFLEKKHKNFFWWKVSDRYTSGLPDYYIIYNSNSVHIELKATGEKPRPIQEYTMTKINKAGGRAVWFDNFDDLKAFIETEILQPV